MVWHSRMGHGLLAWLLWWLTLTVCAQTGWFIPSSRFSSGLVNDVCQDGEGFIWVATDYGLNKFDGYRFTAYLHQRGDSTSLSSNMVGRLYCDSQGQLWVGTTKGLDRYERSTGRFVHHAFADGATPRVTEMRQLTDGRLYVGTSGYHGNYVLDAHGKLVHWDECDTLMHFVNHVLTDKQERFWQCGFGNEFTMKDVNGLHRMQSTQGFVVDFVERGDEVLMVCLNGIHSYRDGRLAVADIDRSEVKADAMFRSVYKDSRGNIWLGTRGDGLFRLAHNSSKLERVVCHMEGIDLNTAKIWAITEDRQGNIWLGCQSRGLLMLQRQAPQFHSWSFPAQGIRLSSTVTSVCEGDDAMIWCTVQGNGVYGFDRDGRIVAHPSAPTSAECIYRDVKNRYWLGTGNSLYAYDPLTGRSQLQATFDCDQFHCMVSDSVGRLYISTFSRGFCIFDPATRQLRNFNSSQRDEQRGWLYNDWVMAMTFDRSGRLWLATSSGVSCYEPKTDRFMRFQQRWNLLDNVLCYSLCETRDGDMMIGTAEGLYIWHASDGKVEPFADGLSDKVVGYVAEDGKGDLWCATPMGIWQYSRGKQQFIGHVSGNGITAREYINCVGMKTRGNLLCFANNEGLTVFCPQDVTARRTSLPKVILTNFLIAGEPQLSQMSTLNSQQSTVNSLTMSYLDNVLVLEFSLLDYNNPGSIVYEYRIGEGKWVANPEGQNSIQLSRLQPGSYQIEVRATALGIHSPVTTLTLEVTPPWYRSPWAYLVYALLLLALLSVVAVHWRNRVRVRLAQEKLRFMLKANHHLRSTDRHRILIVAKDVETANDIICELNPKYKFDYAPNGQEALKKLLTQTYHLVVSDVMMPKMDGITMLKRIKGNAAISEMPVIILSSQEEVEHKLLGLKAGADAYLPKPFDIEELHVRMDNLIDKVRRLRGKFSGALLQEERVEHIEVKGNDDALMERIMRSVNAHMSDPDYNVDALASEVGLSRAQLHRKMKEMTGIATGRFLRNLRMEQAARLLREGKVNVSQVADKVGYTDQPHFSTAFKAHFGLSPSQYADMNQEKNGD